MFTKITLRASAAVSVLAVLLVVPHLVIAQASSWVGQKVVTRYDYPVKIGNQFVEKQNAFHVYTVTKVNGYLLWWRRAESKAGSLRARQFSSIKQLTSTPWR